MRPSPQGPPGIKHRLLQRSFSNRFPSSHCSPRPFWMILSPHTPCSRRHAGEHPSVPFVLPSSHSSRSWSVPSPQKPIVIEGIEKKRRGRKEEEKEELFRFLSASESHGRSLSEGNLSLCSLSLSASERSSHATLCAGYRSGFSLWRRSLSASERSSDGMRTVGYRSGLSLWRRSLSASERSSHRTDASRSERTPSLLRRSLSVSDRSSEGTLSAGYQSGLSLRSLSLSASERSSHDTFCAGNRSGLSLRSLSLSASERSSHEMLVVGDRVENSLSLSASERSSSPPKVLRRLEVLEDVREEVPPASPPPSSRRQIPSHPSPLLLFPSSHSSRSSRKPSPHREDVLPASSPPSSSPKELRRLDVREDVLDEDDEGQTMEESQNVGSATQVPKSEPKLNLSV